MGYVLAKQEGWLGEPNHPPFDFVVLNDFKGLRDGVNSRTADAFMWEYYTTKKYYTNPPELSQIGEIPTPWPSWHIVARTDLLPLPGITGTSTSHPLSPDPRVSSFLTHLNSAIEIFTQKPEEVVEFIVQSGDMHYSAEDARAWYQEVSFVRDTKRVKPDVVKACVEALRSAGVVPEVDGGEGGVKVEEMVVPVTW